MLPHEGVALAVLVVATLVGNLLSIPAAGFLIAVGAAVLVLPRHRTISGHVKWSCFVLTALALALIWRLDAPFEVLGKGILVSGSLISLIAVVQLFAISSTDARTLALVRTILLHQAPVRRYPIFNVASQGMSAALNLAGTRMVFSVLEGSGLRANEHRELLFATTRGFSAAIFWSPMFGNMAVLLALHPYVAWYEVAPLGFLMAQLTVVIGSVMNYMQNAGSVPAWRASDDVGVPALSELRIPVLLLGLLMCFIAAAAYMMQTSVVTAIVLTLPFASLLSNLMSRRQASSQSRGGWRGTTEKFPPLATECLVFLTAGLAGTVIIAAIPQDVITLSSSAVSGVPALTVPLLMCSIIGLAIVGIHPILAGTLVSSVFTPSALALPSLLYCCAVLSGWGLASTVAPFSLVNLLAGRQGRLSVFEVSLRGNGAYALVCFVAIAGFLVLISSWVQ